MRRAAASTQPAPARRCRAVDCRSTGRKRSYAAGPLVGHGSTRTKVACARKREATPRISIRSRAASPRSGKPPTTDHNAIAGRPLPRRDNSLTALRPPGRDAIRHRRPSSRPRPTITRSTRSGEHQPRNRPHASCRVAPCQQRVWRHTGARTRLPNAHPARSSHDPGAQHPPTAAHPPAAADTNRLRGREMTRGCQGAVSILRLRTIGKQTERIFWLSMHKKRYQPL